MVNLEYLTFSTGSQNPSAGSAILLVFLRSINRQIPFVEEYLNQVILVPRKH
jgi:hypothetical protein